MLQYMMRSFVTRVEVVILKECLAMGRYVGLIRLCQILHRNIELFTFIFRIGLFLSFPLDGKF